MCVLSPLLCVLSTWLAEMDADRRDHDGLDSSSSSDEQQSEEEDDEDDENTDKHNKKHSAAHSSPTQTNKPLPLSSTALVLAARKKPNVSSSTLAAPNQFLLGSSSEITVQDMFGAANVFGQSRRLEAHHTAFFFV